jgi:hypothetical protein
MHFYLNGSGKSIFTDALQIGAGIAVWGTPALHPPFWGAAPTPAPPNNSSPKKIICNEILNLYEFRLVLYKTDSDFN